MPVVLMLLLVAAYADASPQRKAIGWQLDPYFIERGGDPASTVTSHDFYPKGETPDRWTERILLRMRDVGSGMSPAAVMDALADESRQACPAMSENRIPLPATNAASMAISLWHCSRNPATGRGQVIAQKVLLSGSHAYVMTAEGDYPPFDSGATPMTQAQMRRWSQTQNSLVLCDDLTNPGCIPDPGTIMSAGQAVLTPQQRASVAQAETRGRELYLQDQLAWQATDFMLANGGLKRSKRGTFIAIPGPGRMGDVYFVQRSGSRIRNIAQVSFDVAGQPRREPDPKTLPADVAAREQALLLARESGPDACAETVNSAVMPAEDGNGWWVYVLTGTHDPNIMYLGGHTRFRVDANGTLAKGEPSAKSCLSLRTGERGPGGEPESALMATHIVSDTPWETHVLQSLTFGKPLIVVTRSAVWRVENGKIVLLDV